MASTATKTIVGDFDLPSFEHCVTKNAGIPPDAQLGYQVKRRMQDGKTWQSEPLREGLYSVQAHPDAVVGLEREMATWGLQSGWYALAFHPLNQPSKTIWRWEIPIGGAATQQQQQTAPVVYQPPSAPQVYQPQQQVSPPMQYPPYAPPPINVQVGPPPPQSYEPLYDRYGRQIDPRSLAQPAPPPPPDPRWDARYGYQAPPPAPAHVAPSAPDPQIAELKAELAEQRRERDADRKRQEEKDRDAAQKADRDLLLAKIEKTAADSDARFNAILSRLDADRNAAPKQTVVEQIVALAPLLLPHLVTMRKDAADAEQASRDREQKLWSVMMDRRTDPMVEKLMADLGELRRASEKSKDPNEQIMVAQTVSQALFASFSMSMKMFEQMQSMMPEASPIKDMLGEFMQGAKGILESYGQSKRMEAERAARAAAAAQPTHTATMSPGAAPPPPQTFDIRTREGMLGYLRQQGAPEDWCTKQWAGIISSLVKREPADAVGEALAATCFALWKTDALPEALSALEDPADFQKPWPLVLGFLPLGDQTDETKAYLEAVLAAAEHHYGVARGGGEETEEETEEADEADGASNGKAHEPEVTPAVPATAAA